MKSSTMRQAFQGALLAAAQRWRRKLFLQGLFIVIAAAVLAGAVAVPIMDASHFAPATVGAARVLVYLLLFVLLLVFLVVRVPRRGDRQRLLEHIDSHAARRAGDRPDARDTLLLTAVQMDADGVDAPLEQRLYERAAVAVNDPHGSARDDRIGMRRAARALLGLAGFVVIILFMLDDGARHGVQLLLAPWRDAQHGMPYRIAVQPGDTALRERSDVVIEGATLGFVPRTLTLVSRGEGEADWSRTLMQVNAGTTAASLDGHFSAERLAVTAPFEYYLEGDNVRSALHRVQVQWLPRAQRIEHVYHYPRYTGIGERVVPSATDIAAVTGSRVEVRVLPVDLPADLTVRSPEQSPGESLGELVLDDSTRRPLLRDGEMLSASLSVDEASRYRIELPFNAGNKGPPEMVPVTPDHGISALADGAPLVTIARPASDARVTAVEEIAISIQADDDVSLRQVELLYSINGEAEEVIALTPAVPVANASAPSTGPASAAASVNATRCDRLSRACQ
jgi:hypothetical protein